MVGIDASVSRESSETAMIVLGCPRKFVFRWILIFWKRLELNKTSSQKSGKRSELKKVFHQFFFIYNKDKRNAIFFDIGHSSTYEKRC